MTKQVSELTNEELNRLAAELVMGWEMKITSFSSKCNVWFDVKDDYPVGFHAEYQRYKVRSFYYFDPADKQDHAFMLQAEIKERGLHCLYVYWLCRILGWDGYLDPIKMTVSFSDIYEITDATARQRTQAAIMAVRAKEE